MGRPMPTFTYWGVHPGGQRVHGEIEAEDHGAVVRQLAQGDLLVTGIRRKTPALRERLGFRGRRIQIHKVIFFARSLATLHRSGVALGASLELVATQATDAEERKVVEAIRSKVLKGSSLAEAISDQSPAFPDLLAAAVEVGEAAGALDKTLRSAADLLERDEEARHALKSALRYPVFVLAAVGTALVVLMTLVVPKFAASYAEMGAALPTPTVILIAISRAVVGYGYYLLGALLVLAAAVWRSYHTEPGRRRIEALILRLPLLGPLSTMSLTSRTCEILKVLSEAGLPVLNALEMGAKTIGNRVFGAELLEVRTAVAEGSDLASRFRQSRVFPPLMGELVSVGERSGAMEEMLGAASDYFRLETERGRKRITALVEPALTICLGLLVLGIALAIFLPIWDSVSLYRGG
jgi:type IV pilus assembly protein PilC